MLIQVLEGENAIAKNRELMGATDPRKADKGTIRADLAQSIDANAVHGSDSIDNARMNAVDASFVAADALGDATFDIVVANILTNALLILAPLLAARVRVGGRMALCGILTSQTDAVSETYRRWFEIETWQSSEDWSLLAGVRIISAGSRPQ